MIHLVEVFRAHSELLVGFLGFSFRLFGIAGSSLYERPLDLTSLL